MCFGKPVGGGGGITIGEILGAIAAMGGVALADLYADALGTIGQMWSSASDKSKVKGIEGKLDALARDLDSLRKEPEGHYDRAHHESTAAGLRDDILKTYNDVGPKARREMLDMIAGSPENVQDYLAGEE